MFSGWESLYLLISPVEVSLMMAEQGRHMLPWSVWPMGSPRMSVEVGVLDKGNVGGGRRSVSFLRILLSHE